MGHEYVLKKPRKKFITRESSVWDTWEGGMADGKEEFGKWPLMGGNEIQE
jgi:hypothetical protein